MKQTIKLIAVLLAVLSLTFAVSASSTSNLTISYPEEDVTVTFDASTTFSAEQRQRIADFIVLDTPVIQSRAWCWLTGHDKITETVTVTYHKEHQTSPRCRLDVYLITTCSKCDYYEEELYNTHYIVCCPED